jgi:CubicO group peptidase (beta-lactamase class C family)
MYSTGCSFSAIISLGVISACASAAPLTQFPESASIAQDIKAAERVLRIEQLAREAVDRDFAPGVVIYIKQKNSEPYSFHYGWRDKAADSPLSGEDLFRVYSMTKPVTVAAALVLVDDGVIQLDDPVSKFIPAFSTTVAFAAGETLEELQTEALERPLTIRDLMRHTSGMIYKTRAQDPVTQLYVLKGIDTGSGVDIPPRDGSDPVKSARELAERIATIPLIAQPGEKYTYGNAIDVLGAVVEVASGQTLGAFMSERLFEPLQMQDTFFKVPSGQEPRMTAAYSSTSIKPGPESVFDVVDISELSVGALREFDPSAGGMFTTDRPMHYGGAGLVTTVSDYARFAEMLLNKGELDGVRVLNARRVEEMMSNQLSEAALNQSPRLSKDGVTYGLGGAIVQDPNQAPLSVPKGTYFWSGAASTFFWVDPENGTFGLVMTQVVGGDFNSYRLEIIDAWYDNAAK